MTDRRADDLGDEFAAMSDAPPGPAAQAIPWALFGSSVRGASHESSGLPNQDAYRCEVLDGPGHLVSVAAVADGHGHYRHFRAARGAELAVEEACRCASDLASELDALGSAGARGAFCQKTLVPTLVAGWRRAVAADRSARPFSSEEDAIRAEGDDDPLIPYGSTLLVVLLADAWIVAAQIGDGDVVALMADGSVVTPVPGDPTLDGRYTTSLCQSSAVSSFRIAVIDRGSVAVRGILMATDGFGNAQTARPWPTAVGRDIVAMLEAHGAEGVREQLRSWTARSASAEGSGDDTTIVLAVAGSDPTAGRRRQEGGQA